MGYCIGGSIIKIRPFKTEDQQTFISMLTTYFVDDLGQAFKQETMNKICDIILEKVNTGVTFLNILEIDTQLCGFILYQVDVPESDWCKRPGWGFIRETYINRDSRGSGYGKLLALSAEDELIKHGVDKIYLDASSQALEFWAKCGFNDTAELGDVNKLRILVKGI